MLYLNKITNDPSQNMNLTGIPGVSVSMALRYLPRMRLWMMSLAWENTIINGIIITAAPNMLRAFKNLIPFGLSCLTTNGLDPYGLQDFSTQAANLYLLDTTEVAQIEEGMFT